MLIINFVCLHAELVLFLSVAILAQVRENDCHAQVLAMSVAAGDVVRHLKAIGMFLTNMHGTTSFEQVQSTQLQTVRQMLGNIEISMMQATAVSEAISGLPFTPAQKDELLGLMATRVSLDVATGGNTTHGNGQDFFFPSEMSLSAPLSVLMR